jgi:hypothetical protein
MKIYFFAACLVFTCSLFTMDHATHQRLRARLAGTNIEAIRNQVVQSAAAPGAVRFAEKIVRLIDRLKKLGN